MAADFLCPCFYGSAIVAFLGFFDSSVIKKVVVKFLSVHLSEKGWCGWLGFSSQFYGNGRDGGVGVFDVVIAGVDDPIGVGFVCQAVCSLMDCLYLNQF